jgi:hypothetical protein
MSNKQTTESESKVWKNVDYTNTWAYRTVQAWKDAATEAGLVLEFPYNFPNTPASQLEHLRRIDSLSKGEVKKTITSMVRSTSRSTDSSTKIVVKEYLTIGGQFQVTDFRGVPYSIEVLEGVYDRPNVVRNSDQKFNPNTGEPIGNSKILSGQKAVYDIELPKDPAKRKKLIDSIIESTDSDKDSVRYYYKDLEAGFRDGTFSYEQFTDLSIEELRDLSKKGGGSKGPGYYRDKDNVLRNKDGNKI